MNWLGWILALGNIFLTVLFFLFAGLVLVTKSWGVLFVICAIACAITAFFAYWISKNIKSSQPRERNVSNVSGRKETHPKQIIM